jgi:hypothetical protein
MNHLMHHALLVLLALLASATHSQAATENQTVTNNVLSTGTTFTFSQFNPSLGSLTAIDLIVNSSTPGGSVNVTNIDSNPMDVDGVEGRFRLTGNATLGLSGYTSPYGPMSTSPSAPVTLNPLDSQAFSISGGQSLIGGSPVTRSISSGAFAQYLGVGNVVFSTNVQTQIDTLGADFSVTSTGFFSSTSLTLRYTYTPSSPVPEPGQVAASVLLLGGIGAYVFIKRRRKSATSVA